MDESKLVVAVSSAMNMACLMALSFRWFNGRNISAGRPKSCASEHDLHRVPELFAPIGAIQNETGPGSVIWKKAARLAKYK